MGFKSRSSITAHTRYAAVIGQPIDHSQSPAIHNRAFAAAGIDAVFLALAISPAELPAAMAGFRAMPPLGLAVTVPHKQAVMGLCDRVTPLAAEIGAVNCVVFEPGGEVVGYNTDAPGYVDGLRIDLGYEPARRRVTLLGSGGAARAVAAGLHDAGAESVTVVARSPDKADWTEALPWTADALAELLPRTDLLVDCTSVGLDPASEARVPTPVDVDQLPASAVVSSLIYHRTPALLRAASDRGLRTQGGGPMLLHQGARQFALWTGRPFPRP